MLTFYPRNVAIIPGLEDLGEYTRESAIVNIIDNDRKLPIPNRTYFKCTFCSRTVNAYHVRGGLECVSTIWHFFRSGDTL